MSCWKLSVILYHKYPLVTKVIAVTDSQVKVIDHIIVIVIIVPIADSIRGAIVLLLHDNFVL